jgi:hypothetical protein
MGLREQVLSWYDMTAAVKQQVLRRQHYYDVI